MLRLVAAQAETLWDEALPIEVRELPADLAALDVLLSDPALLAPFSGAPRVIGGDPPPRFPFNAAVLDAVGLALRRARVAT